MQYKNIILIAFFASALIGSKNIFPKQEERADVTIEYFFQDSVVKIKTEMKDWEKIYHVIWLNQCENIYII